MSPCYNLVIDNHVGTHIVVRRAATPVICVWFGFPATNSATRSIRRSRVWANRLGRKRPCTKVLVVVRRHFVDCKRVFYLATNRTKCRKRASVRR